MATNDNAPVFVTVDFDEQAIKASYASDLTVAPILYQQLANALNEHRRVKIQILNVEVLD
jgi:hypothetical protein